MVEVVSVTSTHKDSESHLKIRRSIGKFVMVVIKT